MNPDLIFLPVIAQILLVVILYLALSKAKVKSTEEGTVDETRRGLYDDAWPESVLKINNCIRNNFELPVLFYVLAMMLWALNYVNWIALTLAWAFVGSRYMHAYVHTGSNFVPLRRSIFKVSTVIVMVLSVCALIAVM